MHIAANNTKLPYFFLRVLSGTGIEELCLWIVWIEFFIIYILYLYAGGVHCQDHLQEIKHPGGSKMQRLQRSNRTNKGLEVLECSRHKAID